MSTVNERLEAEFNELPGSSIKLDSVNGALELTIPSDSKAEIEAETVSGVIDNDFGLHANHHGFVGHDLRGELGNVNGRIEIRRTSDGRPMSPVKDLSHHDQDNDEDEAEI